MLSLQTQRLSSFACARWVLDLLFEASVRLLFSAATDRTVLVWSDRGQQLQAPALDFTLKQGKDQALCSYIAVQSQCKNI